MTYDDIDFNELYKKQKNSSSFKIKSKEAWDKKASSMNEKVHNSIYNDSFLEKVSTSDATTLLDVGCGVGNLSLLFAQKLENVYSLDYSQGMLDILEENCKENSINNIKSINASWDDNWDSVPQCDIVIASRSMEVIDMKKALTKLNEKAKKRVYISFKVGGSFLSDEILKVLQRDIVKKPDYIYLVNILYSMGINAKIDFLQSEGKNTVYTNVKDFIKSVSWSIGELNKEEIRRLEEYYEMVEKDKQQNPEYVTWALISWEK